MPEISCLIVTYKSEKTIGDCLTSVCSDLNGYSAEIIVADNDSQDKTLSIVQDFSENNSVSIKTIKNEYNFGFARAVNQCIATAKGEIILLLNPDTVIHSGFFERMIKALRDNPNIGIVAPQHVNNSGSVIVSCREFPTHLSLLSYVTGLSFLFPRSPTLSGWKMGYFDHKTSRIVEQPMGAAMMVRMKEIETVGYMDERFWMFFNDVDWCRRFRDIGKVAYFLAEARITHFCGQSVKHKPVSMIITSHRAFYRYFKKYFRGFKWMIPNFIAATILLLTAILRILFLPLRKQSV